MNLFIKTLRNIDQTVPNYLWKALLIDLVPALTIAAVMQFWVSAAPFPADFGPPIIGFFVILFLGPLLETILMWPIIILLARASNGSSFVPAYMACVAVVYHRLDQSLMALCSFWPFLIFSHCFIEWSKKSRVIGLRMTFLLHAGHNLVPSILYLLEIK